MKTKVLGILLLLGSMGINANAAKVSQFGAGIRGGTFGIPNALLDLVFFEHPQLKGNSFAFEIHSYGNKGPQSVFSGIYSLEYSRMEGNGYFRNEQFNNRLFGSGEITQISFTATILMHIFSSSPIHPYIGGGIGICRFSIFAEGSYMDELGTTIHKTLDKKMFLPVGHIPIGIMGNIDNKFILRAEAGFKNGFYFGGSMVVNF
ncbi:MAG: hypothetical protein NTW95_11445 [Candidatus Aminicenantes bacterium]|nr:hypothetical protein [Candidatus Aminicenantes bacterium]